MDEKALDEEQQMRRKRRIAEMKRQKKKQEMLRRQVRLGVAAAGICICIIAVVVIGIKQNGDLQERMPVSKTAVLKHSLISEIMPSELAYLESLSLTTAPYGAVSDLFYEGYSAQIGSDTPVITSDEVKSTNAILVDLDTGEVIAQKAAQEIVSPASMTKILTLLVAAEHVTDLDASFTMTQEMTDYAYVHKCSTAGFDVDETVTVRDLMYGTILPSGGEAALGLAVYVAGSQEAFVELMNEKLQELGLSGTAHFTNCIGLYDENHHCSLYDMAMILKAAAENDLCREVLSAHIYTTSQTEQHPDGIELSNWFLRKIEDKDTHGEVICAKTGFVDQSGCCGASYAISNSGKHYICVTGNAWSSWRCIYDHVAIYQEYTN
ncbi:MAG: serine hydrolase [Eubacteriales bacterium]|nr:serine hydrolase [Eubacteriales bacterium]